MTGDQMDNSHPTLAENRLFYEGKFDEMKTAQSDIMGQLGRGEERFERIEREQRRARDELAAVKGDIADVKVDVAGVKSSMQYNTAVTETIQSNTEWLGNVRAGGRLMCRLWFGSSRVMEAIEKRKYTLCLLIFVCSTAYEGHVPGLLIKFIKLILES